MIKFNERIDGTDLMASHINGYAYLLSAMLKNAEVLNSEPITEELELDTTASYDYKNGVAQYNVYKTSKPLVVALIGLQIARDGINFVDISPVEMDWLSGRVYLNPEPDRYVGTTQRIRCTYVSVESLDLGKGEAYYGTYTLAMGPSADLRTLSVQPINPSVTHWALLKDGVFVSEPTAIAESSVLDAELFTEPSRLSLRLYCPAHLPYTSLTTSMLAAFTVAELQTMKVARVEDSGISLVETQFGDGIDPVSCLGAGNLI